MYPNGCDKVTDDSPSILSAPDAATVKDSCPTGPNGRRFGSRKPGSAPIAESAGNVGSAGPGWPVPYSRPYRSQTATDPPAGLSAHRLTDATQPAERYYQVVEGTMFGVVLMMRGRRPDG